eukprot:CAMPEP_0183747916 /NCGR_PEP_ID=MMETSP0737-20130205/67505_1 /TAXON_ID=385413 /ORGANISM="Thalassiosira miniscula, Strain CCMP1093" /LENGTH=277 /DNA_ID=CAMNT_0025983633 /DNA_START=113 /DNA_END=945 /DNA_ORIENTATION=+
MAIHNIATATASHQSNFPLKLISWNISNAHPSSAAPDFIRRSKQSPNLIREECLRPTPTPPDIIALQECPYPNFGQNELASSGYVSVGTRPSHCGYVDLLVREELAMATTNNNEHAKLMTTMLQECNLPSVATTIDLPNGTTVAVSSSHLAPFKDGAFLRKMQCQTLMELLHQHAGNSIHLGDFNMRAAEDKDVENACGGGWMDAWKETGSNSDAKFTWDSFSEQVSFSFMGNEPVEKKGDYLSDHFGLAVELDVLACGDGSDESVQVEAEEEKAGK